MALNIKPYFGPNDPFPHPEVSFPEKEIPLKATTDNDPKREKKDKLKEALMEEEVKWMMEKAREKFIKKLDLI